MTSTGDFAGKDRPVWGLPRPPPTRPVSYAAARRGELPAEALPREAQERLVRELVTEGWTDVQVATHTRWTTYTAGRIRDRLGLTANAIRDSGKESA